MPVVIRGYQERGLNKVWELHEKALIDANAFGGHGEWDDDLKNIKEVYLDSGGAFLVAELEGEIIGMGALKRISDTRAEIKQK